MDLRAAGALVDHIIGCCGGYWSDEHREAWIEAMLGCHDTKSAEDAARLLGNRWQGTKRPGFGDFMALYNAAVKRAVEARTLPPGAQPTMSLLDYLRLQAERAEAGERSARHEIETWRGLLKPGGILSRSDIMPGLEEAREWFAQHPDPLPYDEPEF